MSGSKTIIADEGWIGAIHPGEILRDDFLIGDEIPFEEVTGGTGLPPERLRALLDGHSAVDADVDMRLGRYFGMSEGFFLRLQNSYDLSLAKRAYGAEYDRLARRAA